MGFVIVIATMVGVFSLRFFMPTWILATIIVLAAGGYYQFSYKPVQEAKATIQGN